ncbi:MAG: hypothetical protein HYV27_15750 [Candidatus Hydrogenedentes bacterium]|nr:hypothetical protein [Candidatus Hydrogenedentota bacterium]
MAFVLGMAGGAIGESAGDLEKIFPQPPREYSTGPLWVWNDLLTEDQIRSTLRDLAGQSVKQAWVHPRPGLMTPYLSDDWFRLWKVALDEAERLDMNIWIYDENSYPSGFAGGLVPEAMPESRSMSIQAKEVALPAEIQEPVVAVYTRDLSAPEEVTEAYRDGSLPAGTYIVLVENYCGNSPWYGGTFYVDLIRPGVTEKFLSITMDAYKAQIGAQFGGRVPGVFTDEPHLAIASGLHWTPDLAEQFLQRRGYDLMPQRLSLWYPAGDWKRVRHDYYQTLLDLFTERWAQPFSAWCEANKLELTGHYWEHGWPEARTAPDNMAMYAWHQRPAIDTLFNQYSEDVHAQFGNVRSVLELASAANQAGRTRTLCETYGGAGWDVRFEDLKRIGDWLLVLGVNTLNEHLSQITNRGARKADYPPSFSYHAPWFEAYHVSAQYFTRLSAAMSSGKQINEILVLEPTTTGWMYQGDREKLDTLGNSFQRLITELAQAQIEFDLGSEDIIEDRGAVRDARFVVGERAYHTVVLPPETENLNGATVKLLGAFLEQGGTVLCAAASPPARVDGAEANLAATMAMSKGWNAVSPDSLIERLRARTGDAFQVLRAGADSGILYHQRRQFDDGDLVLLVNTSIEQPAMGRIEARAGGVRAWDLESGKTDVPVSFSRKGDLIECGFDLPPCGSQLLFFAKAGADPVAVDEPLFTAVAATSATVVERMGPNVLTLDYVDVTAGGETKQDMYFYQAAEQIFRAHGLDRNPWDHAVQLRDQLITKTFPEESGFEATYRFTIRDAAPSELWFVVERGDLYSITCNGKPLTVDPEQWWMDRAAHKIDIHACAVQGGNEVVIAARPMTMFHELEPAYVLGNFRLEAVARGFEIVADAPLAVGPWKAQGHAMYGAAMTYTQRFTVAESAAAHVVELPEWYGAVANVSVNGKGAGHIWHAPWRCDVSGLIQAGDNEISVTVFGTPKNTLGPHHGNPGRGLSGPEHFRKAPNPGPPPGDSYDTIDYGLFEPFTLLAGSVKAR